MSDYLSHDPSLFGTVGQSVSDEASLLGDSLLSQLPTLHEGMGESRFAVDIAADGLRTQETGLEAWLKSLREQQRESNLQAGNSYDPVTGINPTSPPVSSGTSSGSNITGIEETTTAAVNGSDSSGNTGSGTSTPAPLRLESETMSLSGGYGIETKDFASGDALIGLKNRKGNSGSAQSSFSGASGTYAVIVGYYDEADGESRMSLELGEQRFEWELTEQLKAQKASPSNLVRRVISSGIELNPGDVVNLTGHRDRGEMARVDYIEFVPIDPSVPLPFRVEAEDMSLEHYTVKRNQGYASNGGLVELSTPSGSTGTASFSFPKASGTYDIVVGYYDESDGDAY